MSVQTELNTAALVETIRAGIRRRTEIPWTPSKYPASDLSGSNGDQMPGEVQYMRNHPSLSYLHQHWAIASTLTPPSIRGSLRRGIRAFARSLIQRAVYPLLRPYVEAEQEILSNMVRLHDALAKRCDTLQDSAAHDALRADMIDLAAHFQVQLRSLEEGRTSVSNQAERASS